MSEAVYIESESPELTANELVALRLEAWDNYLKTGYETFKLIYEVQTDRLSNIGYNLPMLIGEIKIDKQTQEEFKFLDNEEISILIEDGDNIEVFE